MTFLDSLVRVFAIATVVVPIFFLVLGLFLYFMYPRQRGIVGIIVASLGGVGVFLFSGAMCIGILKSNVPLGLVGVLLLEIATLAVGIITYQNRLKE